MEGDRETRPVEIEDEGADFGFHLPQRRRIDPTDIGDLGAEGFGHPGEIDLARDQLGVEGLELRPSLATLGAVDRHRQRLYLQPKRGLVEEVVVLIEAGPGPQDRNPLDPASVTRVAPAIDRSAR